VKRGLTVLKMRGSDHDRDIREYSIDAEGLHVGEPFRTVAGILSGNVVNVVPTDAIDDVLPPSFG
jgi:circadian clock protein KaiC